MICSTLFLHPKEGRFITIGSRLQEVEPSHHKGQNATTINRRSHQQTQGSQILQQVGFDLGIQQRTNQRGRRMEGSFPDEQRTIRTPSDVLWIMQFTGNIPKNDEQHFPRTTSRRSVGQLHGRLCDSSKGNGRVGRKNDSIPEDSRKAQLVL